MTRPKDIDPEDITSPSDLAPDEEVNRPNTTIYDQYQPATAVWSLGQDGLPIEHDPPGDPGVPALLPENMTCLAQPEKGDQPPLPPCKYYKRQLIPGTEGDGRKYMRRMCTHPGMATLSGAYLDLSESAMYGCEMRDPMDIESVRDLDARDARTVARAQDPRIWRILPTPEEAAAGKYELDGSEDDAVIGTKKS